MKVQTWLWEAESIPGFCGVIIYLLSVVIWSTDLRLLLPTKEL